MLLGPPEFLSCSRPLYLWRWFLLSGVSWGLRGLIPEVRAAEDSVTSVGRFGTVARIKVKIWAGSQFCVDV